MSESATGSSPPSGAVVVTGASGGIGFATARTLREHGFRVFGTTLPGEDSGPLERIGASAVPLELTSAESVCAARDGVLAALGGERLAGLVNNAGIADGGPIELLDLDAVRRVFEVNVLGLIAVTQAFIPRLRESRGRIVNVSSVSGVMSMPFLAPYCASKFATEAISDSLRRELHPFGVRVVVIRPAVTRTSIWDKAADQDLSRYVGTPYEPVIDKVQKRLVKNRNKGLDPSLVAAAILRALTEANPPTRIPVLKKRRKYLLGMWLPDRVIDRMVARELWGQ